MRQTAAKMVREILTHPDVTVVPQSREGFLAALAFYQQRPDKSYSLVDCASMTVMRSLGLEAVLTSDRHFSQEGFRALLLPS